MPSEEDNANNQYIIDAGGHTSVMLIPQPPPKKTGLKELLLNDTSLVEEVLRDLVANNLDFVLKVLSEKLETGTREIRSRTVIEGLELKQLKERSRKRALDLRQELGLTEDPEAINGFKEIKGILKSYSKPGDDPVELLRESREE